MNDLGKLLVIIGIVLVVVGAVIWKTGGLGGLGRLPGDITVHKGHSTFLLPHRHLPAPQRRAEPARVAAAAVRLASSAARIHRAGRSKTMWDANAIPVGPSFSAFSKLLRNPKI